GTGGSSGWTYTLDDAAANKLAAGQVVQEVYTVKVDDGQGGVKTQDVTITIVGTNDDPVITSAAQSGEVIEDSTTEHTASGAVSFTDVDLNDTHAVTVTAPAGALLGTFSLGTLADTTGTGTGGSSGWTYTLDDAAANKLAAGQVVQEVYTVKVDDGQGGVKTQDVTITIVGTNDDPVITSAAQSGEVIEDSTTEHTASGAVSFTDVDLNDTHAVTVTAPAGALLGTFSLGTLADTTGTGTGGSSGWTYTLDDAAANKLAAGQVVQEVYTVKVDDGQGGVKTQDVTITIVGTNDDPVITSAAQSGEVIEDSTTEHTASGAVSFTDVDLNDTHAVTVTAPAGALLGTFSLGTLADTTGTGTGGSSGRTYTLDDAAANKLAAGQVVQEVYTVKVDD